MEIAGALGRSLLRGLGVKSALLVDGEAEGRGTAQMAPALALVSFHLGDTFAGPIAFSFSDSGQDGEDQSADAVARRAASASRGALRGARVPLWTTGTSCSPRGGSNADRGLIFAADCVRNLTAGGQSPAME